MPRLAKDFTIAQAFALLVGGALVVAGLAGFLVDTSFGSGEHVNGSTLLFFEVNGWHNVLHLAFGLLGLAAFRSRTAARLFALAWGATAAVLMVWGFTSDTAVFGLVPADSGDNWFHIPDATGVVVAIVGGRPLRAQARRSSAPATS